jgi:hypothetical protein
MAITMWAREANEGTQPGAIQVPTMGGCSVCLGHSGAIEWGCDWPYLTTDDQTFSTRERSYPAIFALLMIWRALPHDRRLSNPEDQTEDTNRSQPQSTGIDIEGYGSRKDAIKPLANTTLKI